MTTIETDLKNFNDFVNERLEDGSELKLPELFELWILRNPTDAVYDENVDAINASINDFMNGERGTRAGVHSHKLRQEFRIGDE